MPQQIALKIGDITVALITDSPDCEFQMEECWERFVTDDQPDVILHVHCDRMPDFEKGQKVFDTGLAWSLYRDHGKWALRVRSPTLDPYQLTIFEPDFCGGDIYVRASESDPPKIRFPLGYPTGELFMMNLLSRGYGVLLHACGVKDGERGLVFVGAGGAGKSTIAGVWEDQEDVSILSDDRIIVRQREGHFWVYGTPWPGEGGMCSPEAAPLDRVFLIQQAKENRAVPLSPLDAASRLLVRSFVTFWDAEGMVFTLELLGALSQAVPCYELGFVPDKSVVDFVRCLM
jgi:hypothetical protein